MDGAPVAGRLVDNSGKVLGVMGPDGVIRAPDGVTILEPAAGHSNFEPQISLRDGKIIGYTGADGSTWSSDT